MTSILSVCNWKLYWIFLSPPPFLFLLNTIELNTAKTMMIDIWSREGLIKNQQRCVFNVGRWNARFCWRQRRIWTLTRGFEFLLLMLEVVNLSVLAKRWNGWVFVFLWKRVDCVIETWTFSVNWRWIIHSFYFFFFFVSMWLGWRRFIQCVHVRFNADKRKINWSGELIDFNVWDT